MVPNDEEKSPARKLAKKKSAKTMEESDEEEDNDKIDFEVVPHVSITVWRVK